MIKMPRKTRILKEYTLDSVARYGSRLFNENINSVKNFIMERYREIEEESRRGGLNLSKEVIFFIIYRDINLCHSIAQNAYKQNRFLKKMEEVLP